MLRKNLFGYRLGYYDLSTRRKDLPPLLQFMVIDSEEVIIACYREPFLPAEREIRVAMRHPDIVKLFQDYYDTNWKGAELLDAEDVEAYAKFQGIRNRLNQLAA